MACAVVVRQRDATRPGRRIGCNISSRKSGADNSRSAAAASTGVSSLPVVCGRSSGRLSGSSCRARVAHRRAGPSCPMHHSLCTSIRSASRVDGRIRILRQHFLGAVHRGNVSATPQVIAGDMDLVFGQRVDQVLHAHPGIGRVFAVRKARHQVPEGGKRILRGPRVAFGGVLSAQRFQQAFSGVEIGQALSDSRRSPHAD